MPKNILPTILDPYTNEIRVLGSIPSDPRLVASIPPYLGEILPDSELKAFNDFPKQIQIKDQNGKGACNGFATAAIVEQTRHIQGLSYVPLSGWFPYAILCNGVDRGSNILQAYKLLQESGICEESYVPYGTIEPRSLSPESHANALKYKVTLGTSYQSWRQIVSAVMLRENLNLSIYVGRSFNTLDSESVPGVDKGPGNHAVAVGLGLKKSKKWGWLILCRNSWSKKWGTLGFCWLAEAHIEAGTYFECFSIKSILDDPDQAPPTILTNLPKKTTWSPS